MTKTYKTERRADILRPRGVEATPSVSEVDFHRGRGLSRVIITLLVFSPGKPVCRISGLSETST